jgi:hypothetical protein
VIGQEKHRHKSKRTGQKIAGHQRRKEQFMTHFPKWRTRVRGGARNVVALGLVISVGACTDTGEFVFGSRDAASAGPAAISAGPATERDVEAPEVFDLTDEGLWDGRPSLGGVWVAHADATDPERVMIRNTENGQFVIGALFRRERENPGPSIQVSSDAAAALDILAGAPTTLHVIALRREEAPAPETPVDDGGVPVAEGEVAPSTGAALPAIAAATIAPEVDVAPALETAATASRPLLRPLDALAAPAVAELPRNMSAEDVMAGITRAAFSPEDLASTAPEPGTRPATSIAAVAEAAITESEITSARPARGRCGPPERSRARGGTRSPRSGRRRQPDRKHAGAGLRPDRHLLCAGKRQQHRTDLAQRRTCAHHPRPDQQWPPDLARGRGPRPDR